MNVLSERKRNRILLKIFFLYSTIKITVIKQFIIIKKKTTVASSRTNQIAKSKSNFKLLHY